MSLLCTREVSKSTRISGDADGQYNLPRVSRDGHNITDAYTENKKMLLLRSSLNYYKLHAVGSNLGTGLLCV